MNKKILIIFALFFSLFLEIDVTAREYDYGRLLNGDKKMTQNQTDYVMVNANHILVQTKDEADNLKKQIAEGASFEELAKKYSKCPSGTEGGALGYFRRGQMVKPFEDAAFETPKGEVSEPIQTQFGWHLIKVIDKQ